MNLMNSGKTLPATALGTHGAEYTRSLRHLNLDPQFTLEDVLTPSFWAHHAPKFTRGDVIDVLAADDSFDVTLRVTGVGRGFATMRVLRKWVNETALAVKDEAPIPENYNVKWAGPSAKYRVVMLNPNMIVSENHEDKASAIKAAIDHAKNATAVAA